MRLVGEKETVGTPIAEPLNGTLCGDPTALSVATRFAVAAPEVVAVKVIVSVQLAPAASEVPQVFPIKLNWLALVPENLYELTAIVVALLVLVTVSTCAAEVIPGAVAGKVRLAGEKDTVIAASTEPLNGTLCGDPWALSVATRDALAVPEADGVKVIDSVQLAPAASEVLQVFPLRLNSLALVPENLYELTETAVALELVTVSTCAAEVVPMLVAGKVMLVGENMSPEAAGTLMV